MSRALTTRTTFDARLKFFLEEGGATPNGLNVVSTLQSNLRDLLHDSSIVVQSGRIYFSAPQTNGRGVNFLPVAVEATFSGLREPTREEWVRALARTFMQTNTVVTNYPSRGAGENDYANGADIVTAALAPSLVFRRVQVLPTSDTHLVSHTVLTDPYGPRTVVNPTPTTPPAPVPAAIVTTVAPVPTAPTTAIRTVAVTDTAGRTTTTAATVPHDPQVRDTVVETTRPNASTAATLAPTATRVTVRTSPDTGLSTTQTAVIPLPDDFIGTGKDFGPPVPTNYAKPIAIGAAVIVIAGVVYYVSTRRGRRVRLAGARI